MSTARNLSHFSRQGANGGSSLPLGQAFLSALVDLIQPVIQSYVPRSGTARLASGAILEAPIVQQSGVKLLSALENFVASTVQYHTHQSGRGQELNNASGPIYTRFDATGLYRSPAPPTDLIPSSLMENLRRYAFNKMPIRLLKFDSKGQNVQLIGRNDILQHISRTAYVMVASQETSSDRDLKLQEIVSDVELVSSYAILSHTWIRDTPGDVVFSEWDSRHLNPRGYSKIAKFCQTAAKYGVTLGWMDTVCINKESSSELDESIRSMYKWYREARVCVAYLAETTHLGRMARDSWFTRGWTLQELLAPMRIEFYNMDWLPLYSDTNGAFSFFQTPQHANRTTFEMQIEMATTITVKELYMCRRGKIQALPFSRKMQMGANRQVTRDEDMAYSMMGILGVDISIAYGEGPERAFSRLVRAFLTSQKYTLDVFNHAGNEKSLIPTSISQYANRSLSFDGGLITGSRLEYCQPKDPITITHLGVRLQLGIIPAVIISRVGHLRGYSDQMGPFMTVPVHLPDNSAHDNSVEYVTSFNPSFHAMISNSTTSNIHSRLTSTEALHIGILNIDCPENSKFVSLPADPTPALAVGFSVQRSSPSDEENYNYRKWTTSRPIVFKWTGPQMISKKDLAAHGMRLQTLYL